jgi:hypothetical protein
MTYNQFRICLCSHRHYPGSCPVLSCGCGELRPDPRAQGKTAVAVAVLDGPLLRVKIAPGFARSLEEGDALAEALIGRRLPPWETAEKTAATGDEAA